MTNEEAEAALFAIAGPIEIIEGFGNCTVEGYDKSYPRIGVAMTRNHTIYAYAIADDEWYIPKYSKMRNSRQQAINLIIERFYKSERT